MNYFVPSWLVCVSLHQVPNVSLLKELRWVNPRGEEIPQDDRYLLLIMVSVWFGLV